MTDTWKWLRHKTNVLTPGQFYTQTYSYTGTDAINRRDERFDRRSEDTNNEKET